MTTTDQQIAERLADIAECAILDLDTRDVEDVGIARLHAGRDALLDAGLREAVEAWSEINDVLVLHGVLRGDMPGDIVVAFEKMRSALAALKGEKA